MSLFVALKQRLRPALLRLLHYTPRLRFAVRRGYWALRGLQYSRLARRAETDRCLVFFEAYGGRSFACSPKALYLEMLDDPRFAGWRFVWSFKEGRCPEGFLACADASSCAAPPASDGLRTSVVVRGSREYFNALAAAGTIIVNTRLPEYVTPKPSQVFVQCWHGTPLKRLGYDVPSDAGGALNTADELARRFGMDSKRWTYLLSPSPYATRHLSDAFGLEPARRSGVVLEEGYPRNDFLARAAADASLCQAARIHLGVPEGKKTLLYAPTWRDDSYASGVGYTFDCLLDLERLKTALSDDWVVLFRAHYYIANKLDLAGLEGFVIDVSGEDDVNVAYAAADVLVTDYSSVMFDFALLRRPIILHAPDRRHYERAVRGFYFPLSEVPGPLYSTTDEVAFELLHLRSYGERYGAAYERFVAKFAPLDDGGASRRVIERVFFSGDRAGGGEAL